MTLPDFLQFRDRDYSTMREWQRRAYLLTHEQPIILNADTLYAEPFTVELALAWAERLAAEVLA